MHFQLIKMLNELLSEIESMRGSYHKISFMGRERSLSTDGRPLAFPGEEERAKRVPTKSGDDGLHAH